MKCLHSILSILVHRLADDMVEDGQTLAALKVRPSSWWYNDCRMVQLPQVPYKWIHEAHMSRANSGVHVRRPSKECLCDLLSKEAPC